MKAADAPSLRPTLSGTLDLIQPRRGYRFSLDALLLGRFAAVGERDRVLELGAGCGVVSILLARRQAREVVALEIQPELAEMARRNAERNAPGLVTTLCADLRQPHIARLKPGSFDLVVANPPYRASGTGRDSPDPGRAIARGGAAASLEDFIAAAARYARHRARIALVFTAARFAETISLMRAHRLEPKRIRFVHPRAETAASIVLIEARKAGGIECRIEPPLLLYERPGVLGAEARTLLSRV